MAQSGLLFLNDRDALTDFSFVLTGIAGWPGMIGSASREVPVLGGPQMPGAILDARLIRRTAGKATARGYISAATPTLALAALDALRGLVMSGGEVSVRTGYATDRYCLAVGESFESDSMVGEDLNGRVNVAMSFVVKDGIAWRNAPDGLTLSSARVACPIGTAESQPIILISAASGVTLNDPTITVRNAAGDSVQTMTLIGAIGSNALRVDCARNTVSLVTAGVVTDALALGWWPAGLGDFPVLRPADGNAELAAYPTVELSAAAGVVGGLITYTRRYV